jgi:hypothetical protein
MKALLSQPVLSGEADKVEAVWPTLAPKPGALVAVQPSSSRRRTRKYPAVEWKQAHVLLPPEIILVASPSAASFNVTHGAGPPPQIRPR